MSLSYQFLKKIRSEKKKGSNQFFFFDVNRKKTKSVELQRKKLKIFRTVFEKKNHVQWGKKKRKKKKKERRAIFLFKFFLFFLINFVTERKRNFREKNKINYLYTGYKVTTNLSIRNKIKIIFFYKKKLNVLSKIIIGGFFKIFILLSLFFSFFLSWNNILAK